jgi:membrane-associated phospholipid phosphatase
MSVDEIILRVKSQWVLKIVLGLGLIMMFAVLYLLPQRYPQFPAAVMQPMWIDRIIPFMPNSVYLYESLLFLIPIAPWLMKSRDELNCYSMGLVIMNCVGFCFFFFYPTLIARPMDIHDSNSLYRTLIQIDKELNAFPSLHTAYALFHSACCHAVFCNASRSKLLPWFFWIWALGITVSTLLTKQHVFADAVAGSILGLGTFAVCCGQMQYYGGAVNKYE